MDFITDCFEYNVFYFFFSKRYNNKGVIDIVISSKKRDSFLLRMVQTRASHSFDPERDSSESGFLDLVTISITLLYSRCLKVYTS